MLTALSSDLKVCYPVEDTKKYYLDKCYEKYFTWVRDWNVSLTKASPTPAILLSQPRDIYFVYSSVSYLWKSI